MEKDLIIRYHNNRLDTVRGNIDYGIKTVQDLKEAIQLLKEIKSKAGDYELVRNILLTQPIEDKGLFEELIARLPYSEDIDYYMWNPRNRVLYSRIVQRLKDLGFQIEDNHRLVSYSVYYGTDNFIATTGTVTVLRNLETLGSVRMDFPVTAKDETWIHVFKITLDLKQVRYMTVDKLYKSEYYYITTPITETDLGKAVVKVENRGFGVWREIPAIDT